MIRPTGAGDRESGMVTVWAVVIVMACVAMVGLVLDGGTILRDRSSTYDLAAESARAGAQKLDPNALAEGHVALDHDQVRVAVTTFLVARGATGDVSINGTQVTVTVYRTVALQILKPATVSLHETATAQAERGQP